MSNYTQTTFFTPKDTLPPGDPNKIVLGAAYDVEFGNISGAIGSKQDITSAAGFTSGTFIGTLTGCTTAPTGTLYFSQVGDSVTLYVPVLTATSNANTCDIIGIPAALQPARAQSCAVIPFAFVNNGTTGASLNIWASPTGGALVLNYQSATGWTTTGTKGVNQSFTITYLLN